MISPVLEFVAWLKTVGATFQIITLVRDYIIQICWKMPNGQFVWHSAYINLKTGWFYVSMGDMPLSIAI